MDKEQLSRVLVRLASTSDDQVCHVIPKLLPPLLCQLSPEPPETRDKALELLSHISKRISSNSKRIQLPVCEILKACQHDAPSFRKRIALTYLKRALNGLGGNTSSIVKDLLDEDLFSSTSFVTWSNTVICCMEKANMANIHVDTESAMKETLASKQELVSNLLEKFRDFLLLSPHVRDVASLADSSSEIPIESLPRGVSVRAVREMFPTEDVKVPQDRTAVQEIHKNISIFCRKIISQDDCLSVLAAGFAEGNQVIKDNDERYVYDLWHEGISIDTLRSISYMITGVSSEALEDYRTPCPEAVNLMGLKIFRKAQKTFSEEFSPYLMMCVRESLQGQHTTFRLRESAVDLVHDFIRLGNAGGVEKFGVELLQLLCKLLLAGLDSETVALMGSQSKVEKRVREMAYSSLGSLSEHYPHIVRDTKIERPDGSSTGVPEGLFELLSAEASETQLSVVEAASRVSFAFQNPGSQNSRLSNLLLKYACHQNARTRQVALEWALRIFPFSDVRARYLCLLLLDDSRQEIRDHAFYGLNPFGKSGQVLGIDSRSGLRLSWELAMESEVFLSQRKQEKESNEEEDLYSDDDGDIQLVPEQRQDDRVYEPANPNSASADSPFHIVAPLYPAFPSLISYICFSGQEASKAKVESLCGDNLTPDLLYGSNFISLGPRGTVCALQFLMTTMIASAVNSGLSPRGYLLGMSVGTESGNGSSALSSASTMRMLALMAEAQLRLTTTLPSEEVCGISTDVLVVLARMVPTYFSEQYRNKNALQWFKQLGKLPYLHPRENAAVLYGISSRNNPLNESLFSLKEFEESIPDSESVKSLSAQRINEIHGALCFIGWTCAGLWTHERESTSLEELSKSTSGLVKRLVYYLLSPLEDVNRGATVGLMVLGRYYPLSWALSEDPLEDFLRVLEDMRKRCISDQSTNMQMACNAIRCLGAIAAGEMRYGNFGLEEWKGSQNEYQLLPIKCSRLYYEVLGMLLRFEHVKHEMLQVQVGHSLLEASTLQAGGFESQHAVLTDLNSGSSSAEDGDTLRWLYDQLMLMFVQAKVKTQKKSTLIWLLSLLVATNKCRATAERLELLHMVFLSSLCHQDELLRQISMRGAGYAHRLFLDTEFVSEEVRTRISENLKNLIMAEFVTSGTSLQYTLKSSLLSHITACHEKLQLFSENISQGFLPPALHSDRSLMELWKLSLVCEDAFIFFHLLAVVNDVHALPPGLDLTKSEDFLHRKKSVAELKPYFHIVIPRFYCNLFEAHARLREYSKHAWSFLVDNHANTLRRYSSSILQRCSVICESDDWSQRVSAIYALSGILPYLSLAAFANNVGELWRMVLRAMDDVHEDVRNCANSVVKELGNVTLRFGGDSEQQPSKSSLKRSKREINSEQRKTVETALTYLLTSPHAISSSVQAVRETCLDYTVRLAKIAGRSMWRLMPVLVENALQGASQLEPAEMSYLQTHANAQTGIHGNLPSGSHIEAYRVNAARDGQMGAILNACIDEIRQMPADELTRRGVSEGGPSDSDEPILDQLLTIVKKSIGHGNQLPTRGLACYFYLQLVENIAHLLENHSSGLMNSFVSAMEGSPLVLQRSLGSCLAYTAPVAKFKSVRKTVRTLKDRVAEASPVERQGIAHALSKVLKKMKGADSNIDAGVISTIYINKFDEEDEAKGAWVQAWDEIGLSDSSALRTHLAEVVDECKNRLQDKYWVYRRMAGRAIVCLATTLASHGQNYDSSIMGNCSVLGPNKLTIGFSDPHELFLRFLQRYGYASVSEDNKNDARQLLEGGVAVGYDPRQPLITSPSALTRYADDLASSLVQVLKGPYWTGKGTAVDALSAVVAYCPDAFRSNPQNDSYEYCSSVKAVSVCKELADEVSQHSSGPSELISYMSACLRGITVCSLSDPSISLWSEIHPVVDSILDRQLRVSESVLPEGKRDMIVAALQLLCSSVTRCGMPEQSDSEKKVQVDRCLRKATAFFGFGDLNLRHRCMKCVVVLSMRMEIATVVEIHYLSEVGLLLFQVAEEQYAAGASFPLLQELSLSLVYTVIAKLSSLCVSRSAYLENIFCKKFPIDAVQGFYRLLNTRTNQSSTTKTPLEIVQDLVVHSARSSHAGVLAISEKTGNLLRWCGIQF
eukprot:gb/GECG01007425.1/.p1 GENE.gb/GECG01007425.1/~~gb/GECG01007425.1/.p1  ORF type:complete len:2121 (+),score=256.73 gb/GECG01007425.1/:1-6363(+)